MIHVVRHEQQELYTNLLDQMYRARHNLYVESRKWRVFGKADGREQDVFDTDQAIYMLSVGQKKRLQGGLRLLPTVGPHMIGTQLPELCTGRKIPVGPKVWEMSRYFVNHYTDYNDDGLLLRGVLLASMVEFALLNGVTGITCAVQKRSLSSFQDMGLPCEVLGNTMSYYSIDIVGIHLSLSKDASLAVRRRYNIPVEVELMQAEILGIPVGTKDVQTDFFLEAAFNNRDNEFWDEFAEILPLLSSSNPQISQKAEQQLDSLANKVRAVLSDASSGYLGDLN